AKAMECTTGVRTAPMGAGWTWNTLADSACSHHIPSLAPAVALPAPRHDRRRTGAAGSPPGGFPFVELTSRDCEIPMRLCICAAALRAADRKRLPRTPFIPAQARIQCRGLLPALVGTSETDAIRCGPSLDSGNSLCYRTQPLRGPPAAAFRAHSSVGRAADS